MSLPSSIYFFGFSVVFLFLDLQIHDPTAALNVNLAKLPKFIPGKGGKKEGGHFHTFSHESLRGMLCILQLGNYNSFEGVLYCRPHFDQLFKMTGSLDKSFEGKSQASFVEKGRKTV